VPVLSRFNTRLIIAILLANIVIGVFVFHAGMALSFLDSIYFVLTVVTTIGFGDVSLLDVPLGVKLYGMYLMVSGAGGYALIFAWIADDLVRSRLLELTGRRGYRMKDHVIICGFGRLGPRILDNLLLLGDSVLVVHNDETPSERLRARNIPLVVGDATLPETLTRASVATCKSVVCGTDNDLVNLETALTARELNPDVRLVLRIYDQNLGHKIEKGFGIPVVLSTSAISAPTFAQAAHGDDIIDSTLIGERLILTATLHITAESTLCGLCLSNIYARVPCAAIAVRSATTDYLGYPPPSYCLQAGDILTFSTDRQGRTNLQRLNAGLDPLPGLR